MASLQTKELEFIRALHNATLRSALEWRLGWDPEGNEWDATIDGDALSIKRFTLPDVNGVQPFMFRVTNNKTWFCCCAGTEGYSLILEMLSPASAISRTFENLDAAIAQIELL